MTIVQADKLIKSGSTVIFSTNMGDVFTGKAIKRDRTSIYIQYELDGKTKIGVFPRSDVSVKQS